MFQKKTAGFTFIELLLVLGIAVVLVTIGIIYMGGQRAVTDLKLTGQEVSAALELVRSNSVTGLNGETWGIRFISNPDGPDSYEIFTGATYDPANVKETHFLKSSIGLTSSFQDIVFDSSGRPGQLTNITLSNRADEDFEITVNSIGQIVSSFRRPNILTPGVTTNDATAVSTSTATLNAQLTSVGGATIEEVQVWFEWQVQGAGSWSTTTKAILSEPGNFSEGLTGLTQGETYDFRAVAENTEGKVTGSTKTFTTITTPTVTTGDARDVSTSSALLVGNLDSTGNSTPVSVWFEYKKIADPTWATTESVERFSTGEFTQAISGLEEGTQYDFKAFASNIAGQSEGVLKTFTPTAESPTTYSFTIVSNPEQTGQTSPAGTGQQEVNEEISILADPIIGWEFVNWTAPAGTFASSTATSTTFTMPAQDVTVTANFQEEQGEIETSFNLWAVSSKEGTASSPQNAVGPTDNTWTDNLGSESWTHTWNMDTPPGALDGTQTVNVVVKRSSNKATPSVVGISLYENGGVRKSLVGLTSIASDAGQTLTGTFDPGDIGDVSKAEIVIVTSNAGAGPNVTTVLVDSIEWQGQIGLPPGTPGTPTYTNITDTTLTVDWTPSSGKVDYYKVQRAPDSGGAPGTFVTVATTSELGRVAESDSYGNTIRAIVEDDTHIYIGGYMNTVRKLNKNDLSYTADTYNYGDYVIAMAGDDNYLYVGGRMNTIVKINKSDLSSTGVSYNYGGEVRAIVADGDYVYVAGFTTDRIHKLNKSDLLKVTESVQFADNPLSLITDTTHIYVGIGNGLLRKFNKSDLSDTGLSYNHGTNYAVYALSVDDTHIYVGGWMVNQAKKLNKSDLSEIASGEYGGYIYTISGDSTHIYVGGVTDQRVKKFLKSNLSMVAQSESYGGSIFWITDGGEYIYVGGATDPRVKKLSKSSLYNQTSLSPNTTYWYRIVAVNNSGETTGGHSSVTTSP